METKKVYSLFSFLLIFLVFSVNLARSESHFVLVHTAGHGAWCWYKLVPLLKSTGHNVTAFDLAASGINPKHVLDVPFVSDYFRPLTEFMASIPRHEKVILVGHSYGGLAMSHAMERFPEKISVAVFVAAWMPGPHTNFSIFFQEVCLIYIALLSFILDCRNMIIRSTQWNFLFKIWDRQQGAKAIIWILA